MIRVGGYMLQISLSTVCRVYTWMTYEKLCPKDCHPLPCRRRVFAPVFASSVLHPDSSSQREADKHKDAPSFSLVHRGAYERTPPGTRLLPRVVTSSGTSRTKTPPSSPCRRDGFVRGIGHFGVRAQVPWEESRTVRVEPIPHRGETAMSCSGNRSVGWASTML